MEPDVQDDFLSFETDLVAEQLTYMDAVSMGARPVGNTLQTSAYAVLTSACFCHIAAV